MPLALRRRVGHHAHGGGPFRGQRAETSALARMTRPGTEQARTLTGAEALREVRDTIVGLLREPDQAMCAECVAAALGQHVGVIMMIMLGLPDRLTSYHGRCSTCHRPARVVRREAPARS